MDKAGLVLVILITVLGVGFIGYKLNHQDQSKQLTNYTSSQVPTAAKPITSSTSSSVSPGLANKKDSSDQALDKDFQEIQGGLNKLNSDQKAANSDSSSQDTPPAQ